MVFWLKNRIAKYLSAAKYLKFVSCIFICALLFVIIPNVLFFLYLDDYDLFSRKAVIDNLSSFAVYILCVLGVVVPIFLRYRLISDQYLNELKKKQRLSKIEKLKEQINPTSFFKTLRLSGSLAKSEPDKASAMLMKLSRLLRYQLYDCNRDKVLLTAEITFIRDYLELERLCSPGINYALKITGNLNAVFISPSVLLPYVQTVINIPSVKENQEIEMLIDMSDCQISFTISILNSPSSIEFEKELTKIRERLNTLYRDRYALTVTANLVDNRTEICLKLDK